MQENGSAVIDRYSYKDVEQEFGIKSTSRGERIKAAIECGAMPPVSKEGKTPFLTPEHMAELRWQHDYLLRGGTFESYREARGRKVSLLAVPPEPTTLQPTAEPSAELDRYWGDVPPIPIFDDLRRNALDAIAMNPRLIAYAQLEGYMRSGSSISDDELIEIFGWKPPRSGFTEECYKFVRYGKTHKADVGGRFTTQNTWKVEKLDLDAIKRKKTRMRLAAKKEERQAIENYEATKNIIEDIFVD